MTKHGCFAPDSKFWVGFINNDTLCYAKGDKIFTIKLSNNSVEETKTIVKIDSALFSVIKKLKQDVLLGIFKKN